MAVTQVTGFANGSLGASVLGSASLLDPGLSVFEALSVCFVAIPCVWHRTVAWLAFPISLICCVP